MTRGRAARERPVKSGTPFVPAPGDHRVKDPLGPHESELARLVAPHAPLGLPMPAYHGRSLPNVTRSVVDALGIDLASGGPSAPPLDRDLDPFEGRRAEGTIVVLLVDGFGWSALASWSRADGGTAAGRWAAAARPITSVFASTTTAALPSLSAAAPPSATGMVGYRQYLPGFGVVADLLRMMPLGGREPESLVGPTWAPGQVSGVANIFARGVPGVVLGRSSFRGTGFTRLLYDGAQFVGYGSEVDLAALLRELLERPTPPPLVFAYWDGLDTIQHLWGPRPELVALELDLLARTIAYVRAGLSEAQRARTTFLVTGDHGQVPIGVTAEIALDREEEILRHLAHPPAGDRRVGFFAARPGELEDLREALARRLPPGSRIVEVDAALRAGLAGPPPFHPELRERLGDLLAFVPSPAGFTFLPPGAAPADRHRDGAHGGLESEELIVPLIAAPLRELG
jgi:hypothetical protein